MKPTRRLTAMIAVAGLAVGCTPGAQPQGSVENPHATPVCLASYNIDHTSVPDDNTILFYMRDHSVWKNTLIGRCYGLRLDTHGFTYTPTSPGSDTICSNLVTIRTNTLHNNCLLGTFTQVSGPVR